LFELKEGLDEARKLGEDVLGLDDEIKSVEALYDPLIDEQKAGVKALEDKMWYRVANVFSRSQKSFRDITRVGIRNTRNAAAVQELRAAHENFAPLMRRTIFRDFDAGLKKLNAALGGEFRSDDLHVALSMRMIEIATTTLTDNLGRALKGPLPDDDIYNVLRGMQKDLSPGKVESLMKNPDLDEMAGALVRKYEDFRHDMMQLGVMTPDFDPSVIYQPLTMTEAARAAGRVAADEAGEVAQRIGSPTRRAAIRQKFLMPRMTNRMRMQMIDPINKRPMFDEAGKPIYVTIFKGQLKPGGYKGTSPHAVVHGDPDSHAFEFARTTWLDEHPEDMLSGDYFDRNLPGGDRSGPRWLPQEHITTPQHLNNHRTPFLKLVGESYSGPIFETDPLIAFAKRVDQQTFSLMTESFRRTVMPQILTMSKEEFQLQRKGVSGNTRTINGIEYRQLDNSKIKDAKIRFPLDDPPEGVMQLWPDDLATEFENFARTYRTDEATNQLFKIVDKITTLWKGVVLYLPRWTVINIVGSTMLAKAAGADLNQYLLNSIKYRKEVARIHGFMTGGVVGKFSNKLVDVGGETMTMTELMQQAVLDRIANSGRVMQEILTPVALSVPEAKAIPWWVRSEHPIGKYLGQWFKMNAFMEDLMRVSAWVSLRNQGHSRQEAGRLITKYMFDYGDLSYTEHRVGVRLWPFFRWLRNNAALQMKMTLEQPRYAALYPKLVAELQEAVETENSLPEAMRPHWLRDQLAIGVWNKKDDAVFMNLNSFTPAQELFEIGQMFFGAEGFSNFMRYFASSMNPLVKNIFELGFSQEMFTRFDIGKKEEGAAITHPEYAFRQMGALYELAEKIPSVGGFNAMFAGRKDDSDVDIPAAVTRFLIGGRLQKRDIEKLIRTKRYETGESTTRLRFGIRRAVERGDEEEAHRLSLRYIAMHRQLWDIGMVDMVPTPLKRLFRQQDFKRKSEGGARPLLETDLSLFQ
jgi:hypothetical protein